MNSTQSLLELKEIEKQLSKSVEALYRYLSTMNLENCLYERKKVYIIKEDKKIVFEDYFFNEAEQIRETSIDSKYINDVDYYINNLRKTLKEFILNFIERKNRLNEIREKISRLINGKAPRKKVIKKESLMDFCKRKAKEYNLVKNETVQIKIINEILREAQKKNLTESNKTETIRTYFNRLGYSQEREFFNSSKKSKDKFPTNFQYTTIK
jgi:hypothetical protein